VDQVASICKSIASERVSGSFFVCFSFCFGLFHSVCHVWVCVCVCLRVSVWIWKMYGKFRQNVKSKVILGVTCYIVLPLPLPFFFFLQNSVLSYSILEVYPTAIELTGLSTVRKEIHVFDEHCNKMWERKHFFFFLLFLCFLFKLGKMRRMILPSRLDPSAGRWVSEETYCWMRSPDRVLAGCE